MADDRHPRAARFWGWHVIGALFVAGFMLYGAGLYSFILFVPHLTREFHWTSAAAASLVSAFWISAPLSLGASPLIQKVGARRLVAAGIVIEAASLIALCGASTYAQIYWLRALAGLGKVAFAITLPIIASQWFSRRYALAVAVIYSGWALGGLALAPFTGYLLATFDWRTTSVALGGTQLCIALPAVLWALSIQPPNAGGTGLDGDAPGPSAPTVAAVELNDPHSGRYIDVLKTLVKVPAFRLIAIATPIYYLVSGAVLLLQAAMIQSSGGSADAAAWVVSLTAGSAALGMLLGGWLFDRSSPAISASVVFVPVGVGMLALLIFIHQPIPLWLVLHGAVFGFGIGAADIFWISAMKRRLPTSLFTGAWGVWYFLQLASLVVAPACAGLILPLVGGYRSLLIVETAGICLPFLLTLLLDVGAIRQGAVRPMERQDGQINR